ncbi:MAG: hypothetical protein M3069_30180 [Chloroflexota bacterium]|nr:hypothetical protein [Chloroflexota bacterium]
MATRAHCLELKREADDVRQQLARAGRNAGKPQSIASRIGVLLREISQLTDSG